MSLRTPDLKVEIAVSNMSLLPDEWNSNLEQLAVYCKRTNYRNVEIHPTQGTVEDIKRLSTAGDTELIDRLVGSLHQTFSHEGDFYSKRGVVDSLGSVASMMSIQCALSEPVPSIHYPTRDNTTRLQASPMRVRPEYPGSFPVVQPAVEVYREFGASNDEELMGALELRGFTGLCPDTVHARRQGKDGSMPPPVEDSWLRQFQSGDVYETHLALGRVDVMPRNPKLAFTSIKELAAFALGHGKVAYKTQAADMMVGAIENYALPERLRMRGSQVLRTVIEIPPGLPSFMHARVVENVASVVSGAGATPLLWDTSTELY